MAARFTISELHQQAFSLTFSRRFETCALGQDSYLMRVGCSASVCVRDEVARAKWPGKWSAHRAGGISMKVVAPAKELQLKNLASEQKDVLFTLTMALSGERQVLITASVNAVLYTILMQINIHKWAPVNFAQMPVFGLFPLVNFCG